MPYLTERLQQHYTGETAADLSGAGSASGWRSASSAGAANRWQQASQAVLARVRLPSDTYSCFEGIEPDQRACCSELAVGVAGG